MRAGFGQGLLGLRSGELSLDAVAAFWLRARPDSAVYELRNGTEGWTPSDYLLAVSADYLQQLVRSKIKNPAPFKPLERPTGSQPNKEERVFGRGTEIPISEMDAWLEANGWVLPKRGNLELELNYDEEAPDGREE